MNDRGSNRAGDTNGRGGRYGNGGGNEQRGNGGGNEQRGNGQRGNGGGAGGPGSDRPAGRKYRPKRKGKSEHVGDLLGRILRRQQASGPDAYRQIRHDLGEILTPQQTAGIEVRGLRSGTLTLGVRSSPLKHELESFYGGKMLSWLQREKGRLDVRTIRFQLVR